MAAECCCQLSDSLLHPLAILQSSQRIVAVQAETIRLMAAVDETIAARGGWPIG
jgi:hypothetical protein